MLRMEHTLMCLRRNTRKPCLRAINAFQFKEDLFYRIPSRCQIQLGKIFLRTISAMQLEAGKLKG